jgi:hypothetical protein
MRNYRSNRSLAKAAVFALLYAGSVAALAAQSMTRSAPQGAGQGGAADAQVTVSGRIGAVSGGTIFVTGADGAATSVAIGKDTLILGRKGADLTSIRPGDALGVAAVKAPDGSLSATAINVFSPELWQRVRKGQFPMANGQVMTNAQVERTGAGVQGRLLYLKYEMLTAAIVVPASADIRRSVTLGLADLKPGLSVAVRGVAGADGILAASSVSLDLPAD